jgi:hypothetical protein
MDVVLHVGAHRTASTTFQKTLGANGAALAAAGVAYWGPKYTRAGLFGGLIGRPGAVDSAARATGLRRVARCAREVERAGARVLIVSEENALGSMRAALTGQGFYNDAGARVAALAEAFGDHPVRIGMAIRAQAEWWRSVDAFGAGRIGIMRRVPLDDLAEEPRAWRDVIGDVAARAGPVAVWSHEAMADRPDAVLARLTGKAPTIRPLGGRKNASDPARRATLRASTIARLDRRYRADLDWLRAGADGQAEFMDAGAGYEIPPGTGEERGRPDDGKLQDQGRHQRRLA